MADEDDVVAAAVEKLIDAAMPTFGRTESDWLALIKAAEDILKLAGAR